MSRSSNIRIDPWSRWANFTMESWECWFNAYWKHGTADAPKHAAEHASPRGTSAQGGTRAHQRIAQR